MQIQTHFTKDKKVKKIILDHLDNAKTHVCVAVAWFTDRPLFDKLIELLENGIQVEVVITNHEFNHTCSNNYKLIEKKGGFFAYIGNDEKLMHMKFCVIDYDVVISGSANWSNKAFTQNNEEVTIVEGHAQRANDFIEEFDRLKLLSGKIQSLQKELDLAKAFKIFDLIKAFVAIGEKQNIRPYVQQLKSTEELTEIVQLLIEEEYEKAIHEMDKFKKTKTQLVDVTGLEIESIKVQIQLIAIQIEVLTIQKVETEALIEQFNHRYIIELNPIIGKILALKKKIYEKLHKHGIEDDTYHKMDEEFQRNNEEYQEEIKIEIPDLKEDENQILRELYREGSKLCHPDSPRCVIENENKAAETFDQLTKAYKLKDLNKVKQIVSDLRLGNPINELDKVSELETLLAKLASLQVKYDHLVFDLKTMHLSEEYITIKDFTNWDDYFKNQKEQLENQYENLTKDYVKHE
ncbi:phospholipase D-like domain-containing protein [Flavobacterium frigoris]|uniref:phospholipase D n=1 Tax=Flavobacterium frigoris TaxID=229204 RepID=A0A1H9I0X1_FLAFI|nr:phospholipase D-like domain-containing protein [Flavobacterium frigoris]SEQ68207.1 PLD-like domain-containing protein [Flavobacterium frigoris]